MGQKVFPNCREANRRRYELEEETGEIWEVRPTGKDKEHIVVKYAPSLPRPEENPIHIDLSGVL